MTLRATIEQAEAEALMVKRFLHAAGTDPEAWIDAVLSRLDAAKRLLAECSAPSEPPEMWCKECDRPPDSMCAVYKHATEPKLPNGDPLKAPSEPPPAKMQEHVPNCASRRGSDYCDCDDAEPAPRQFDGTITSAESRKLADAFEAQRFAAPSEPPTPEPEERLNYANPEVLRSGLLHLRFRIDENLDVPHYRDYHLEVIDAALKLVPPAPVTGDAPTARTLKDDAAKLAEAISKSLACHDNTRIRKVRPILADAVNDYRRALLKGSPDGR